jgi:hypothetical protein
MNFNEALQRARQLAIAHLGRIQEDIVLVRDLRGRIRLLLQTPPYKVEPGVRPHFKTGLEALAKAISDDLSPTYAYPKSDLVLFRDNLSNLFPNDISLSFLGESDGYKIYLHDRLLIGSEWDTDLPEALHLVFDERWRRPLNNRKHIGLAPCKQRQTRACR